MDALDLAVFVGAQQATRAKVAAKAGAGGAVVMILHWHAWNEQRPYGLEAGRGAKRGGASPQAARRKLAAGGRAVKRGC